MACLCWIFQTVPSCIFFRVRCVSPAKVKKIFFFCRSLIDSIISDRNGDHAARFLVAHSVAFRRSKVWTPTRDPFLHKRLNRCRKSPFYASLLQSVTSESDETSPLIIKLLIKSFHAHGNAMRTSGICLAIQGTTTSVYCSRALRIGFTRRCRLLEPDRVWTKHCICKVWYRVTRGRSTEAENVESRIFCEKMMSYSFHLWVWRSGFLRRCVWFL